VESKRETIEENKSELLQSQRYKPLQR